MTFPDWSGRAVACLASGPSLTLEDCELVRGLPTIVTNTTYEKCPWADVVFGFDLPWWAWHFREVEKTFAGLRFCDQERRGVINAREHPHYRSFGNSGACAIALAIACGASTVVVLGLDCQKTGGRSHHHGSHRNGLNNCDTLPRWPKDFAALAAWSAEQGARVINASRVTALTCFERMPLEEALRDLSASRVGTIAPAAGSTAAFRGADD